MNESTFMLYSAIVLWICCGILSYGYLFSMLQNKYPRIAEEQYNEDRMYSIFLSICSPVTLIVLFLFGHHKYGLKFK